MHTAFVLSHRIKESPKIGVPSDSFRYCSNVEQGNDAIKLCFYSKIMCARTAMPLHGVDG